MSLPVDHIVLGRLAFGASPEDSQFIQAKGLRRWVDQQLAAPVDDDAAMRARLAALRLHVRYGAGDGYPAVDEMRPLTSLDADIKDLWHLADGKAPLAGPERQAPRQEVAAATLQRAIHSPWQLREVLVDFWHNHFNVNAAGDNTVAVALPSHDRAIRAHALGNFRELLETVAGSTAMLAYLNNRSSRAGSANENYARELFELHTLGRDAYLNDLYNRWREVPGAAQGRPTGYIDQDVYEAARAFTGWTVEDGSNLGGGQALPASGRFTYVEAWHDGYQKRVLATDFDPFQPPLADGRKVLDLVAFHPATARFVCTKLCRRLVADRPSESLVEQCVRTWRASRLKADQIAQVVRVIAGSKDIAEEPGSKVKRPLELVASYARAAGIDVTVTSGLINELDGSGQRLFGWAPPTGHPDTMDYWLSSHVLRRRWSLVLGLSENWWQTGAFNPSQRLAGDVRAGDAVRQWHTQLTASEPPAGFVEAILGGMKLADDVLISQRPDREPLTRRIVAYCAMSPAFQLR
jgi:uncharacterized protein (DUF1800 family)